MIKYGGYVGGLHQLCVTLNDKANWGHDLASLNWIPPLAREIKDSELPSYFMVSGFPKKLNDLYSTPFIF